MVCIIDRCHPPGCHFSNDIAIHVEETLEILSQAAYNFCVVDAEKNGVQT